MKRNSIRIMVIFLLCISGVLFTGCGKAALKNAEHEPLTLLTTGVDYQKFETLLKEKYPEINLELISYTGGNGTAYSQYLLEKGKIPDIYTTSVFGMRDEQRGNLLDLSGYEFLNSYKTADINQVSLEGAVYLVPASLNIIGLYYNQTLFSENGWKVPENFAELKALIKQVKEAGLDPVSAQFDLPGNGFFDLFTMAKTDFLSTPNGIQWEQDFKTGKATAAEGLSDAVVLLQELIDCGFWDAEDTGRSYAETWKRFCNREAAMYLNAGTIQRFTENEDGTGDRYGIMPFYGEGEESSVLITLPLRYFGLSKSLADTGNEQKLEDALKVMEIMATEEGQQSMMMRVDNYITPLKNTVIPENSSFYEVQPVIRNGHTSTLAYAGYEPIVVGVGEKVRDWIAGKCTGADVLSLMDELQTDYLMSGQMPVVATATTDFTMEETAQLQAEALRQAAGTDIGMVSLGQYHDGVENLSGVCGQLFEGDISEAVVVAIAPGIYTDPVCILTISGKDIKQLIENGLIAEEGMAGFPYIPVGISVIKDKSGAVKAVTLPDGTALAESAFYTVAVDEGGFSDEAGENGKAQVTELVTVDVIRDYFRANTPLSPLEHSIK